MVFSPGGSLDPLAGNTVTRAGGFSGTTLFNIFLPLRNRKHGGIDAGSRCRGNGG